jgi:hypothetical protein
LAKVDKKKENFVQGDDKSVTWEAPNNADRARIRQQLSLSPSLGDMMCMQRYGNVVCISKNNYSPSKMDPTDNDINNFECGDDLDHGVQVRVCKLKQY